MMSEGGREGTERDGGMGKNAGPGVPFIYLLFPSQNVEFKKAGMKDVLK